MRPSCRKKMILRCHELADPVASIKNQLNSKLFRWDDELQGCMIKCSSVGIKSTTGDLMDELPYVLAEIKAKGIAFCPKPGVLLQGTIQDYSQQKIGIITLT